MSLSDSIQKRFARQIRLSEIGETGQQKLSAASVLVIGAGGLGCPALQYLAGAGVGRIGIVDFDKIELSNLHRQLLFDERDIGKLKAEVAAEKLRNLAPLSEIIAINKRLDNALALGLFPFYDLIIDGTDQVHIRYLINDACRLLQKTWIYGAVNAFQGQWSVFNYHENSTDYRDIFPIPPNPMSAENCEITGTLGMVPGRVGLMQALEAVKFICGLTTGKTTILHTENMLNPEIYSVEVGKSEQVFSINADAFLRRDYENYVLEFYYPKRSEANGT